MNTIKILISLLDVLKQARTHVRDDTSVQISDFLKKPEYIFLETFLFKIS